MIRGIFLLLLLGRAFAAAVNHKPYDGYRVYRLHFNTSEQLDWLAKEVRNDLEIDFWNATDVMVSSDRQKYFLGLLLKKAISWEILINNVHTTMADEHKRRTAVFETAGAFAAKKYYRYESIQIYLRQLAARYPQVVSLGSIGKSFEGRTISVVKISAGGNGNRSVILIDAGIHAREWIAPAMALYIIQQLVENHSNADLIANVNWHIIPVLNPDGYEYSHTNARLWRKTRSETVRCFLAKWASDTKQGVDANRNFDLHWSTIGASKQPCDEDYAGHKAFSEPESVALRDYVLVNAAKIKLYISLHSYGNYILYPWSYTKVPAWDWRDLHDLASRANDAQIAAGGRPYAIGAAPSLLYPAAGASHDWVKGVVGIRFAYTIELPGGGQTGFDLPASAISRTVRAFWPAIRVFGEHIARR